MLKKLLAATLAVSMIIILLVGCTNNASTSKEPITMEEKTNLDENVVDSNQGEKKI